MTIFRKRLLSTTFRKKDRPAKLRLKHLEDRITPAANFLPPTFTLTNVNALTAVGSSRDVAPLTVALNYLNAHASEIGLSAGDIVNPIVTNQYTDVDSGMTHIYLRQQVNGLAVAYADLNVSVLANGEVYTVAGGFVNDLA